MERTKERLYGGMADETKRREGMMDRIEDDEKEGREMVMVRKDRDVLSLPKTQQIQRS